MLHGKPTCVDLFNRVTTYIFRRIKGTNHQYVSGELLRALFFVYFL